MNTIKITFTLLLIINVCYSQDYHPWQRENRYKPLKNKDIYPFNLPIGGCKCENTVLAKLCLEETLVISEFELQIFVDSLKKSKESVLMPEGWGELYPIPNRLLMNPQLHLCMIKNDTCTVASASEFAVEGPLGFESYSICYDFNDLCPLKLSSPYMQASVDFYVLTDYIASSCVVIKEDTVINLSDKETKYELLKVDLHKDGLIDAFKFSRNTIDKVTISGDLGNNEKTTIIGTYIKGIWYMTSFNSSNEEYSIGY